MRTFIVAYLIVLSVCQLSAQDKSLYEQNIDSLTKKSKQFYYIQKDSAYHYFREIYKLSSEYQQWLDGFYSLVNWNRQAIYFYDLTQIKSNINLLDSISSARRTDIDESPDKLLIKNSLLWDKAMYYYNINDYNTVQNELLRIVNSYDETNSEAITKSHAYLISVAYALMAKTYRNEGKYDLAKQYYIKNIQFFKKHLPNDVEQLFGTYSLLAEVYRSEGDYALSKDYFRKSFVAHVQNNSHINNIISDGCRLVQSQTALSQLDSAAYYLKVLEKKIPEKHPFWYKFYEAKGDLYKVKGQYQQSNDIYEKALASLKQKWNNRKHDEIALLYNEIGLMNFEFHKYGKALEYYDLAMEQVSGTRANSSTLLKILKNKSVTLNRLDNEESYSSVIRTVNTAIETLDTVKPSFKSQADKLTLIEDVFPIFESGLEAAFNLQRSSQDGEYIDSAFKFSEESKSVLLLEALLGAKATEFANIPSVIVERESQLKSQITIIEKKINSAKATTEELENDLFDVKKEYRQLIDTIETNYKAYYDLKYSTAVISLQNVQEKLKGDEQLISFFYGNEAIYAIGISKSGKQFERIPIDNLFEENITNVHRMLADPKSDIAALGKTTHVIYQKLLEPFLEPSRNKLTIIADGLLNYIPFSALNTDPKGLDYLAANCSVRYANSATLLSQLGQRKPKAANVLALAPSFNGTSEVNISRSSLMPLPHNEPEVAKVLNAFEGRSLVDKDASLQNFKKEFEKFNILHLATHAVFNDSTPEYSYLAFSQNDTNDNEDLLFVADLYTIKTDADLVTLSACESGIGELRRGEGFMGLSRGFFYGGAASIASTLWKINDASSAELMGSFYNNLANGDTKDKALQKAQKAFLKTNSQNALAHPYYWSGFVISGNNAPLKKNMNWGYLAIGAVLIVTGVWTFRRKKRAA